MALLSDKPCEGEAWKGGGGEAWKEGGAWNGKGELGQGKKRKEWKEEEKQEGMRGGVRSEERAEGGRRKVTQEGGEEDVYPT